jgi:hypothetical protein
VPQPVRFVVAALALLVVAPAARAQPQLELMPALGFGKATGTGSDGIDVGPGLLLSAGARMHPMASLRGQVTIDRPSLDEGGAVGVDTSLWMFRAEIVPAFHLGNQKLDFGAGPAAGFFYMRLGAEVNSPLGRMEASASVRGLTLGLQTWLMIRVNPQLSVGPVFSYGRLWASKVCSQESGSPSECDSDPDNDDEGYWNLWLGVLF